MNYVHERNAKLESTLQKINSLIEKSVLESLGKEYQLHMYGSRATKLCLPWSDIDYVISYTKNNYIDPLKILYDYLYTIPERFFIDMKYIPGASIPVLKIFTNNEYHKISLDISMENQEHHGEECVNYIKNKIKEFEVLTPITFALKTILQKAFLNDPYKGGLSSYGVILLIINFLNVQNKRGNDITINSLGKLFYDILYYYGFEHDVSNPIILDDKTDLDKVYFFHQFQIYKKEFIDSTKAHITGLAKRDYSQNEMSPDYVLMFIPIEGCYSLMFCDNCELWDLAWKNKIMPVSPSTLLASLKIINAFHVVERRNKSAIDIANLCASMIDKFSNLLSDILKARAAIDSGLKKLEGKGNILSQIEKIQNLGVVMTKSIPELPEDLQREDIPTE
jgi:predicted nucleotidyltransferase